MADPWVSLLIGGTILLVGFAAYLAFQRYHLSLKLRQAGRAHLRCGPRGTERLDGLELRNPDASE